MWVAGLSKFAQVGTFSLVESHFNITQHNEFYYWFEKLDLGRHKKSLTWDEMARVVGRSNVAH